MHKYTIGGVIIAGITMTPTMCRARTKAKQDNSEKMEVSEDYFCNIVYNVEDALYDIADYFHNIYDNLMGDQADL